MLPSLRREAALQTVADLTVDDNRGSKIPFSPAALMQHIVNFIVGTDQVCCLY
jgi:hypothetical protein